MLLFPEAAQPSFLSLAALPQAQSRDSSRQFHFRDFSLDKMRNAPALDLSSVIANVSCHQRFDLPSVMVIAYSSQQSGDSGEFLLEIRAEGAFSEIHLPPTHGQLRLTAAPWFGQPDAITSCKLYGMGLAPDDSITIHRLSLTRQYDPEAMISGFRYSDLAYNFPSRRHLTDKAAELMSACYEHMRTLRVEEELAGNSGQDAILPFTMEHDQHQFPYIIGNLNGLYWYGLDPNMQLDHLTTANGMQAGDIVLDCGSHTGYVACAMAKVNGQKGKVICFDPFPQNNYCADMNRQLNGFNIEVANAGVGRETASILASNAHQFTVRVENAKCKEYRVVALDDYYSERPTFLKIDVEGFELEALLGAKKILRDLKPRVFIELHPQFFQLTGASYRQIYDAFPAGMYKLHFHHSGKYDDIFENHLDAQPLGNLYAEPIS
jgi:FkbM family methyltransferase